MPDLIARAAGRVPILLCSVAIAAGCDNRRTEPERRRRDGPLYHTVLKEPVDSLCVVKHLRELSVYRKGVRLKIYRIALGAVPVGHKHIEGDKKTPEGIYTINDRNAASAYHKNLGVSYPNSTDRADAMRKGVSPGGDIKIHGLPRGREGAGGRHRDRDWTDGCLAVTNEEIDELFASVKRNAPILILP